MSETNSELEAFRRKWREEVSARAQGSTKTSSRGSSSHSASKGFRQTSQIHVPSARRLSKVRDEDEDEEIPTDPAGNARRQSNGETGESSKLGGSEPQSALEHYEKAVERENEGSLGESLNLYRKAFRVSLEFC
jgi:F-box protein 9